NPTTNRIRVVADPATNSLLVKASPIDMLSIRRLLDKAIDADDTDSRAVIRTWIIPLKHASAMEVANVIRDVYKEHMNASTSTTVVSGFPGFSVGGGGGGGRGSRGFGGGTFSGGGGGSSARPIHLSIGVDDRSNQIVAACSEVMYED